MTIVKKERKGKGLLYLIAIAVLISIVSIACSDKPTAVSDFAEIDDSLVIKTNGSGNNAFVSTTIADTSIDSPVVVANGDNIILAYGKGNKIYYRSSKNGGDEISIEYELGNSTANKKYPHIFFDGATVTAIATSSDGKIGMGFIPLHYMTVSFLTSDGNLNKFNGASWGSLGIINKDNISGQSGGVLNTDKYFGIGANISVRVAAGAGRIVSGKKYIVISQENGTQYAKLEAKTLSGSQTGTGWDLVNNGKGSDKQNSEIAKLEENGNVYKTTGTGDGIVEKVGSGSIVVSITANGKVSIGGTQKGTVGNGTSEASIAVSGDKIYTLTKENDGLVFRKFGTSISGDIK